MTNSWFDQWVAMPAPVAVGFGAVAIVVAIVLIALKGFSLWTAAKRNERWWFVFLLILNTFGILELVYLLFVAKKWQTKS